MQVRPFFKGTGLIVDHLPSTCRVRCSDRVWLITILVAEPLLEEALRLLGQMGTGHRGVLGEKCTLVTNVLDASV